VPTKTVVTVIDTQVFLVSTALHAHLSGRMLTVFVFSIAVIHLLKISTIIAPTNQARKNGI